MTHTTRSLVTSVLLAMFAVTSTPVSAQEQQDSTSASDPLAGTWSVAVGFGEIPFLAGSFKPSVSFGYHFNEYVYLGAIVQLRDVLERGTESFNARNTGLGGIESTREETGVRSMLQARVRPHRYSPYLSVGVLFNGSDTEEMRFDARERTIGGVGHNGNVVMEQTRPWAVRPAIGLGYAYTMEGGLTLSVEMSGAFFMKAPKPEVRVSGDQPLPDESRDALVNEARSGFAGNFHNRYHLFHIGAGYAW